MSSNEECYIQTTFQLKSCTVKELPSNEAATKATPFIIEHSSGKHSDYSHVQEQGMRVLSQIRTAQSIHVDIKEQKKKKKRVIRLLQAFIAIPCPICPCQQEGLQRPAIMVKRAYFNIFYIFRRKDNSEYHRKAKVQAFVCSASLKCILQSSGTHLHVGS